MEHFLMIVKKEDMKKVSDFFQRNDIINADTLDSMMEIFGDAPDINNFNLYLDRRENSNYEYTGWDANEDITFDNFEESYKLIMNEDDLYNNPFIDSVIVDSSNVKEVQSNIQDYYFNNDFSVELNIDVNDDYKKPAHYKHGKYDLITHLADILTEEELRGFLKGNVIKYIDRYRDKNGIEDLEKAREYTHRLEEFEKKVKGEDNEFIQ